MKPTPKSWEGGESGDPGHQVELSTAKPYFSGGWVIGQSHISDSGPPEKPTPAKDWNPVPCWYVSRKASYINMAGAKSQEVPGMIGALLSGIIWAVDDGAAPSFGREAQSIGWAVVYAVVGGIVGIALVLGATFFLPHLINRLTPDIDEEKEIARGNRAVAEYFGRVVAASILGVSIVVAAAILGGIIAALL